MPFTPTDTTLYATFHYIGGIPRIAGKVEKLWSPQLMVLSERQQSVLSVAVTPNGAYVISGLDDGTIGIWDAASGVEPSPRLQGHLGAIRSVACSPDSTRIASGSDDSTIRLWDLKSTTKVADLNGHKLGVTSVCFSPTMCEGVLLLSGSRDRTIRLWNVSSSLSVDSYVVDRFTSSIIAVAFSPDGQRIISGATDGTIRVRDTDSSSEILCLSFKQTSIQSVAFSPNGQWIVSGSHDGAIGIWNAELGAQYCQPLKSHERCRPIRSLAFFPDGKRIISGAGNGTIRVWDFERGKEDRLPLREHLRSVEAVVVSNDGRRIISGSKDHSIRIWDVDHSAKVLETEISPVNAITVMALSHDGANFAIGLKDQSIRLLDTIECADVLPHSLVGHEDTTRSLSFSPVGGKIASGADKNDGSVRIWDTATGKQMSHLWVDDMGSSLSLAFSRDGHRIASGSKNGIIRIWDLLSNLQTLPLLLRGHGGGVSSIAFSPDGTQIVSGSMDSTVRVWDAKSCAQISPSFNEHESMVRSVEFSSDALQIFCMSKSHNVVYTRCPTNACGQLSSKTKIISHRTSHVLDPFILTPDGWIVDISLNKPVSKLPPIIPMLAVTAVAASKASLLIATNRGAVIIMHFQ